jgi:nitrogen regulatory protein PII
MISNALRRCGMKMIEAIVQPFKLDEVKQALSQIDVCGLTVSEVQVSGDQKGKSIQYRGTAATAFFIPKLKLQVVVPDSQASRVEEAIVKSARTGEAGDGRVYVYSLDQVARIRTGERGDSAL